MIIKVNRVGVEMRIELCLRKKDYVKKINSKSSHQFSASLGFANTIFLIYKKNFFCNSEEFAVDKRSSMTII